MFFRLREVAGWLLVGLGLAVFYVCYCMLVDPDRRQLIEAGPMTFIGFIIFRGGIHILKVAVAAHICSQSEMRSQKPDVRSPKPSLASRI